MPQVCKPSTLIESLCYTTLTLLVCVPVCPQSWCLPHLSSSPLLCLLTLSLPPPPPPCVEMVHIMCLQTHAYRQIGLLIQTLNTTSEDHIYVWHYTPSHNTPQSYAMYVQRQHATIHARVISGLWLLLSLNFEATRLSALIERVEIRLRNIRTILRSHSQPSFNKMVGYSDTTIRDGCIECTVHVFFGGLATYCTPSPSSHLRLTSVPSCSSSSSSDLCFPVLRRHRSRSSGRSSFSRESFASNVGTEHRSRSDRHNG